MARVKCQRNRNRRPSQSTSTTPARTMLTHRSSFLVPVVTAQLPITTTTITTRSRPTASASARIPGPPPRHALPPHLLGGRTFWRALSPPPPPLLGGRCGWSEPVGIRKKNLRRDAQAASGRTRRSGRSRVRAKGDRMTRTEHCSKYSRRIHKHAAGFRHSDSVQFYSFYLMYNICYYHTSRFQRKHPASHPSPRSSHVVTLF